MGEESASVLVAQPAQDGRETTRCIIVEPIVVDALPLGEDLRMVGFGLQCQPALSGQVGRGQAIADPIHTLTLGQRRRNSERLGLVLPEAALPRRGT
jgi:hypothetical protein